MASISLCFMQQSPLTHPVTAPIFTETDSAANVPEDAGALATGPTETVPGVPPTSTDSNVEVGDGRWS